MLKNIFREIRRLFFIKLGSFWECHECKHCKECNRGGGLLAKKS
jgi:hypothetical protein